LRRRRYCYGMWYRENKRGIFSGKQEPKVRNDLLMLATGGVDLSGRTGGVVRIGVRVMPFGVGMWGKAEAGICLFAAPGALVEDGAVDLGRGGGFVGKETNRVV
jgi:hypothetical protein